MNLSDRQKRILSTIVEEYITTGEPVGSKYLAASGIGLSSATIRNEMAELAELGFINSPHTSAGRVPTQFGYRLYVDALMSSYKLSEAEKHKFDNLSSVVSGDIETTLEKAGDFLSNITGYASVSTVPDEKSASIKRIEIMPAGTRSMLLVILTNSGIVKSCIFRIEEDVTTDMLEFFSRFVNDRFSNKLVETITSNYISAIKRELFEYTYSLSPVLDTIYNVIRTMSSGVLVGGTENLLTNSEFDSVKIIELMKFLQKRNELLQIINGFSNDVQVKIGNENGNPLMNNSAIITAPYSFNGKNCGTVGILGPSRINYPKMVSNLKYFADNLTKLINDNFGD